jgi:hypothetical protein
VTPARLRVLNAPLVFWIYLFVLGLISIALAWTATSAYGAGVGTDGVIYLSTADSLLRGKGLTYFEETPLTRWPPLYPAAIAAISRLAGTDVFISGWYLNAILMGVIVWLGGALLYQCCREDLILPYLGSLVIASSVSLLSLSATIGSDPLFIALVLAFLLIANQYQTSSSLWSLLGMTMTAGLACLQRLPGVILIATGILLIAWTLRKQAWRAVKTSLAFAALAAAPLLVWIVRHNYYRYNTFLGSSLAIRAVPWLNLQASLEKISHWFLPYSVPYIYVVAAACLAALLIFLIGGSQSRARLIQRVMSPPVLSSLVFSALYFTSLLFSVNSDDTNLPYYDRYQVVLLVPLLVLIFTFLQELVLSRLSTGRVWAEIALLFFFAVWLVYPTFRMYKYVIQSRSEGEITYNRYNTRRLQQLKIVGILKSDPKYRNQNIYTNYPAVAWFFTRGNIYASPRALITEEKTLDKLLNRYQGWPGDRPGYLVWFIPNEYLHVYDPHDLRKLAELKQVYRGVDGAVYQVKPGSP